MQNNDFGHESVIILNYICIMPMRILSILLISVMMYKPIMCAWTVIDFAMNRDYIAAYLCENQNQPELECQGKCFLMTKLKKQMNDSADHKAKQLTQLSKIDLMDVPKVSEFKFSNQEFQFLEDIKDGMPNGGHIKGIFQPPIV